MAASMLAYDSVDALTHDQHLALLRYLADTVLDSERMRGLLQSELCVCGGGGGGEGGVAASAGAAG